MKKIKAKKLRTPSMDAAPSIYMSDLEHENIKSVLLKNGGKNCDWCDEKNWDLRRGFYTDTLFGITQNSHIHTKVSLSIGLFCKTCGNKKFFSAKVYGLTTSGLSK